MDDREKRIIQKLQVMIEQGSEGEKQAARNILKAKMKKLNLTEKDLMLNKTQPFTFKIKKTQYSQKLFFQILSSLVDDFDGVKGYENKKYEWVIFLEPDIAIELEAMYEFYCDIYSKEEEKLYTAFLYKHDIFPKGDVKTAQNPSRNDWDQIVRMANSLDNSAYLKQIGCKKG